ncbi:MAG: VCBS repeat-containing protein [Planctomycetales bacterium]|nr:VCBS repeat-containing protein [Planctomycetales bacterium]
MSPTIGFSHQFHSGRPAGQHTVLEWVGGGVAAVDFDLDGQVDFLFAGGGDFAPPHVFGKPGVLYQGSRDWHCRDITSRSRLEWLPTIYTHGVQAADVDNDGFTDVLVTGYGGLQLFHNQGDGTFIEIARPVGLVDESWSTGAAWGDFNGDGNLDLYVGHYLDWSFSNHPICKYAALDIRDACPPKRFQGLRDTVYYSTGDGRYIDATDAFGVAPGGKALGVLAADLDGDSDTDIYVANDTTLNFLYVNDGNGTFREMGVLSGTAGDDVGEVNGSMGVDVADYDSDGDVDLWVTNYVQESFALYRNEGFGQFQHVSRTSGVNAIGGLYVGFGTSFHDWDADGDDDLLVVNGHVLAHPPSAPVKQRPFLLSNHEGRFTLVSSREPSFMITPRVSRGLATADVDRDGDLDVIVTHLDEPPTALRNEAPSVGTVQVRLIGTQSARDAIGANVILKTNRRCHARVLTSGASYLSTSERVVTWHLRPGEKPVDVAIKWPRNNKSITVPIDGPGARLLLIEDLPSVGY